MRWIANGARERLGRSSADGGDESARGAAGDAGPFFRAAPGSDAFARESDAVARAPLARRRLARARTRWRCERRSRARESDAVARTPLPEASRESDASDAVAENSAGDLSERAPETNV